MSSPHVRDLIRDAFHTGADLPPSERATFLESLPAGVRAEVESLFAAEERAGDFLEVPAAMPRKVGPYRLVREVGRGGMGTVYEAEREDDAFRKRVAVKLVRGGAHHEHVLRRFRNERQILASLEHPNIARLIDGGTTDDGLPYFVMELVDGLPIDRYCEEHALTTAERVRVFRVACSAVESAHQQLVVHRDLKPSNLVVTPDGAPKLLDFGISKVLQESEEPAEVTATELRALTPDYASPEQVLGQRITTSSDVYSLGVILYRLLAGTAPYAVRDRSPHEIARVVTTVDPPKPSAVAPRPLQRELRGDLDNIVLMAMQKDPGRRYASVQQLSEDLRRYLEGLPVTAQPDRVAYRAGKFVRRNMVAVAGAAAVLVTLLGGIAATTRQSVRARAAQREAEQRSEDVRKLAGTLVFELDDAIQDLPGSTHARELLVTRALRYLDTLAKTNNDPRLQLDLAQAYQKVGDIQGNPQASNLGHGDAAAESYRKSLRLLEQLDQRNRSVLDALGRGYDTLAEIVWDHGDIKTIPPLLLKSIAANEQLARRFKPTIDEERRAANVHLDLGDVYGNPGYQNLGRTRDAMREYLVAASTLNRLAARAPRDLHVIRDLYDVYWRIGFLQNAEGDTEAAVESTRKAIAFIERVAAGRKDSASDQSDLALAYHALANPLRELGRYDEALAAERRGRDIVLQLVERDPRSATWGRHLSVLHLAVGRTELELGRASDALRDIRAARAISEALLTADADTQTAQDLAITWRREGDALDAGGDRAAAIDAYRHGTEMATRVLSHSASNVFALNELGVDQTHLGALLPSLPLMRQGVATLEKAIAASPGNRQMRDDLAAAAYSLARALPPGPERCQYASRSAALWDAMRAGGKLRRTSSATADQADRFAANCR